MPIGVVPDLDAKREIVVKIGHFVIRERNGNSVNTVAWS